MEKFAVIRTITNNFAESSASYDTHGNCPEMYYDLNIGSAHEEYDTSTAVASDPVVRYCLCLVGIIKRDPSRLSRHLPRGC